MNEKSDEKQDNLHSSKNFPTNYLKLQREKNNYSREAW